MRAIKHTTTSADRLDDDDERGPVGPARVSGRQLRELLAGESWLDELIDRASEGGVQLTARAASSPR